MASSSALPVRPPDEDLNGPIGFPMRMVMVALRNLLRLEKISGRPSSPTGKIRACVRVAKNALPGRAGRRTVAQADAVQSPQARQPADKGWRERHVESADEIQRPGHGADDGQRIDEMEVVGGNDQWSRFWDILDSLYANPSQ